MRECYLQEQEYEDVRDSRVYGDGAFHYRNKPGRPKAALYLRRVAIYRRDLGVGSGDSGTMQLN